MESLLNFILYFLFCYGFTAIFQYSDLVKPIRDLITWSPLKKMTECSMCLGFWVGLINALLFFDVTTLDKVNILPYGNKLFLFAVASSGVTWMLVSITQYALWAKCYYQAKSNCKCEDKDAKKVD